MRYFIVTLFVFVLSGLRGSAQIVKSASWGSATDSGIHIFQVSSDGTIDFLTEAFSNNSGTPKLLTDTLLFAIDKSILVSDSDYVLYRIWSDGEVLVNWTKADFSENNKVSGKWYKLTKENSYGRKFVIDLKDRHGKLRSGGIVAGRDREIYLWGIYNKGMRPILQHLIDSCGKINCENITVFPEINLAENRIISTIDTTRTKRARVPALFSIPYRNNDLIFLMGTIANGTAYEYRLTDDNDLGVSGSEQPWVNNGFGNNLIEVKDMKPGKYTLSIRYASSGEFVREHPSFSGDFSMDFPITVRPPWYQTDWFDFAVGILTGIIIGLTILFIYRTNKRAKLKEKELKHRATAMQLQSYRSQLNPHFVFNALSSIQSLVNRNDNEHANQYLTDFSSLLRVTLDQAKTEFWTLQDEIELLKKYVSLEQLRFRFSYEIKVEDGLHPDEVSFPSMLLQPTVENAIKHVISVKGEAGRLEVMIYAQGKNLMIDVKDNGEGFDVNAVKEGIHGISLTRERIALLNEMNTAQQIKFSIISAHAGTVARFYLYDYL